MLAFCDRPVPHAEWESILEPAHRIDRWPHDLMPPTNPFHNNEARWALFEQLGGAIQREGLKTLEPRWERGHASVSCGERVHAIDGLAS